VLPTIVPLLGLGIDWSPDIALPFLILPMYPEPPLAPLWPSPVPAYSTTSTKVRTCISTFTKAVN